MIHSPPSVRRAVPVEIDEMFVAGRYVTATFAVDINHQPAQQHVASPCYYDSPPDPAETTIEAVAVVDWSEYDVGGRDLGRTLTEKQIVVAAMERLQEWADDR